MPNGRCRMHGGTAPVGIASAAWKNGSRSRYLPKCYLDRYAEAQRDSELLVLRTDLAMIEARIAERLGELETGDRAAIWEDLLGLMERRRRLVDTETKRLVAAAQTVTLDEVRGIMALIAGVIRDHVADAGARKAIAAAIAGFTGPPVVR